MNNLLVRVFLTVIIVLTGCATTPQSANVYGIPVQGQGIVFALDISHSMDEKYAPTTFESYFQLKNFTDSMDTFLKGEELTKLESARKELARTLEAIPPQTKFTIIAFAGELVVWKPQLVQASVENKNSALSFLKQLSTKSDTVFMPAIERAFKIDGVNELFFFRREA
jgi:hypothetical protein